MMRVAGTSVAACLMVAVGFGLGAASGAHANNEKPGCSERRNILGVSRVLEIDTTGGPRFGNNQYKDIDFLRPGEVVLTFDDGPLRSKTAAVLNALERHCTKATFFMVGRMALVDPAMVREIDRRGHTIGTHTWSHKMQGRLSSASGEKEIELGVSAVSLALGKPVAPFFRFPYLSDPARMQAQLKGRNQGIFSIDVDSLDFRTRSGSTMKNRVLSTLKQKGKGIILMHDIQRSTAAGVSDLLDALAREGYKVVHIVAKKPIKTLPRYDKMAEDLAERRKKYANRNPLTSRSIVWPVASASEFPVAKPLKIEPPGLFKGPLPERSGLVRPPIEKLRESLAESEEQRADIAKPAGSNSAPSALNGRSHDDWRDEIFNN